MESFFFHYLTLWRPLGYGLVFGGMLIEGDVFILATMALMRFGYFDLLDLVFFVAAGTLVGDSLWFTLGSRFAQSKNRFIVWLLRHVRRIPINTERNFFWKLLMSKFMYGTHRPFLVSLGSSGMPFRYFIARELPAAAIWITVLSGLGYAFAEALSSVRHAVRYLELSILLLFVVFMVLHLLEKRRMNALLADVPGATE